MVEGINILIYDVGSTYTKLTAFKLCGDSLEYAGRSLSPTTVADISEGLGLAREKFMQNGYKISDECEILASSSAAGGLRMVALGYMPRVTAKAAKEVAMSAGARVLEIISHEDLPEYREEILMEIKPDIILLAGGTDGGDTSSMTENAKIIGKAGGGATVIIAGNADAQQETDEILEAAGKKTKRVPNVMPNIHELRVKPARNAIHEEFIKEITKAKGLGTLISQLSNKKVIPTPGAVLLGAELLAKGTYKHEGVGELVVIDIGGATTDIHSVLPELSKLGDEEKGLVITNEKQPVYRTVEGNLGLRVSACGILETVGAESLLSRIGLDTDEYGEKIAKYCAMLEKTPAHIAESDTERMFDRAMAVSAAEVAIKRHAGYISKSYDPVMGIVPGTPVGRDLRKVKYIFAVGGIFAHSDAQAGREIVLKALRNPDLSLLPEKPEIIVDSEYFLYAIGVMAERYGDLAFEFAKKWYGQRC